MALGAISGAVPADLSTTIEAYVALRLAGDEPERRICAQPASTCVGPGDRAGARVHPHLAGAVRRLGLGAGARAPGRADPAAAVGPAERLRLRLLGAADGRGTVGCPVAIAPVRPLPFAIDELRGAEPWSPPKAARCGRGLLALDRVLHVYQRRPVVGCASSRWRGPSDGSSIVRRRTVAGVGSSRRGSTR